MLSEGLNSLATEWTSETKLSLRLASKIRSPFSSARAHRPGAAARDPRQVDVSRPDESTKATDGPSRADRGIQTDERICDRLPTVQARGERSAGLAGVQALP
jgi:hypothetical protein